MPSGSHPISDQKMLSSTPVFRPGLWAEIMLSLLRLERKQKNSLNPFGICIFLFLSYSFGIETINTFIHSRSSLKNHTDSRPKWTKCIPVFRPNRRKNPTRWGGACLAYKGVPRRVADRMWKLMHTPVADRDLQISGWWGWGSGRRLSRL